jgi:hypothetical protein
MKISQFYKSVFVAHMTFSSGVRNNTDTSMKLDYASAQSLASSLFLSLSLSLSLELRSGRLAAIDQTLRSSDPCVAVSVAARLRGGWPGTKEPYADRPWCPPSLPSNAVLSNVFIYCGASDWWLWRRGRRVAIRIIIIIK